MDPASIQLAMALAAQGLRMWADFTDRAAAGTLTDDDLDAMAERLGTNLDALRVEIAAAKADGR